MNLKQLLDNSPRCHICGGLINLKRGVQYDHKTDYAISGVTDPDDGAPVHSFCNNNKKKILEIKKNTHFELPKYSLSEESVATKNSQLNLFDWSAEFPS